MKDTILRYKLPFQGTSYIEMPNGAEIFSASAAIQDTIFDPKIYVWARVNSNVYTVTRKFYICSNALPDSRARFIATILDGNFVWHVFDGGEVLCK